MTTQRTSSEVARDLVEVWRDRRKAIAQRGEIDERALAHDLVGAWREHQRQARVGRGEVRQL